MGPAMNLILAVVVTAIVLYQGAEVPAYRGSGLRSSATWRRTRRPRGRHSPRRPHRFRQRSRRRNLEGSVHRDRNASSNREVTLKINRNGVESPRKRSRRSSSPSETRFEIGDIGVLPERAPVLTASIRGSRANATASRSATSFLAVNGKPHHLSSGSSAR